MRQHKLALCEVHYPEWFVAQTQRFIEKYRMFGPDERVLVAVSGGKDSLALWDVLLQLGYQADGLYINLGIDDYSAASCAKIEQFVAQRPDTQFTIVDIKAEYGETLPQVAGRVRRGRGKPCSVCGLVKRHVMNRITRDGGYDALATGHNLDDEVAVLFGNVLHWQTGYIARQSPVLPASSAGAFTSGRRRPTRSSPALIISTPSAPTPWARPACATRGCSTRWRRNRRGQSCTFTWVSCGRGRRVSSASRSQR
jgi:tRNA(Ile)-lysidine synthase TilS/MesJ